ncbi:lysosomal proton-coupled steroid conjugate and bile acid symporter SLC46A3-like [Tubulanus polymorphus]|uniref:lysosomal proton-coupled steroid conjugate and bile acid symporter SLC46A3-like n=1 Tax=Tubulanus polymorphus TaxID=672921 RepID=UPI003DA65AEC
MKMSTLEEENALLIEGNQCGVQENRDCASGKKWRFVIIEPIMLLYTFAEIGLIPITQQYLYSRFGNMSYLQNSSQCSENTSNPHQKEIDYMQEETSKWSQYIEIAYSSLACILVPVIGTYVDTAGRRVALLVPCFFALLQSIFLSVIIYFHLPVYCLVFVKLLQGIGSWEVVLMVMYTLLSDTTKPSERAIRMTITQGIYIVSTAVSEAAVGFWIQNSGYLYPCICMAALLGLNWLYVYFLVPETLDLEVAPNVDRTVLSSCTFEQRIRSLVAVLRRNENGRRVRIIVLNILVFLYVFPSFSSVAIIMLIMMDTPLCWGPLKIGIYQAVYALILPAMSIPGIKMFKICLSEISISCIGIMSSMASFIVLYLITAGWGMYLACAVNGFSMMTLAIFRAMLSKIVESHERGKIFALVALVEAVCGLIASPSNNAVYRMTVSYAPRTVFLMNFAFVVVAQFFVIFYMCYVKRLRRFKYHTEEDRLHYQRSSMTQPL